MKSRRSRWVFACTFAIALATALWSLPSLAPLVFSSTTMHQMAHGAGAPPANASWQVTLMSGGW